ncbi:MAG: histidine kinase [Burkholderiales bacterium]
MTLVRAPPDRLTRYPQRVKALMAERAGHILLIGLITCALDALRALPLITEFNVPVWESVMRIFLNATTMAAAVIVGISLAQASDVRGWRHILLMMLGGMAVVFLLAIISTYWQAFAAFGGVTELGVSKRSTAMYLAWEYSAVAIAASLFYAAREREARLASEARAGELEQQRAQRTMLESRLAVLRARVEPEFLFAALEDVRGLYRRDAAAADEMLDALIVYLRAALPQMRGEASTIGREVDLVSAYAGVLQVPRREVLQCEARASIEARDIGLPPMVLLPLVQAVFTGPEGDRRRRLHVDAAATDREATIRIEVEGGALPGAWRDPGPDTVRTLRAYFGDGATLRFGSDGVRHSAQLRIARDAA